MLILNKGFEELTNRELYQIIQLRIASFMVEQGALYQDLDGVDLTARHLILIKENTISGYLRLSDPNDEKQGVKLSRLCVAIENRGHEMGYSLLKAAIEFATQNQYQTIYLTAQEYLAEYYKGLGFIQASATYMINNIAHIEMQRLLP